MTCMYHVPCFDYIGFHKINIKNTIIFENVAYFKVNLDMVDRRNKKTEL